PPRSSEPSTMRVGAAVPTAAPRAGEPTSAALSAAMRSTTRPSASVTTVRVRSGRRLPRARPSPEPTVIATTLTRVPRPGIRSSDVFRYGGSAARGVAQHAGQAGGAHAPTGVVGDLDVPGGQGAAGVDGDGHPGDVAGGGAAVVGRVDLDAHG